MSCCVIYSLLAHGLCYGKFPNSYRVVACFYYYGSLRHWISATVAVVQVSVSAVCGGSPCQLNPWQGSALSQLIPQEDLHSITLIPGELNKCFAGWLAENRNGTTLNKLPGEQRLEIPNRYAKFPLSLRNKQQLWAVIFYSFHFFFTPPHSPCPLGRRQPFCLEINEAPLPPRGVALPTPDPVSCPAVRRAFPTYSLTRLAAQPC